MAKRYLIGAIVGLAAVGGVWCVVAGRETGRVRAAERGQNFARHDGDAKRLVYPTDPEGFWAWWTRADAASRRSAVDALNLPESRGTALSLIQSTRGLEWGDPEFYSGLGPFALDALKDIVWNLDEDSWRKECAFSIVTSILEGEERVRFLQTCLGRRDVVLQIDAASWISGMAWDESFVADDEIRRALARAIDENSRLGGDWIEASEIVWPALVATLDANGVQLKSLLADDDAAVRAGAARVTYLWAYNVEAAVDEEDLEQVQRKRAEAVVQMLVSALADAEPRVRQRALQRLRDLAFSGLTIPSEPVLARLADRDEPSVVRAEAARTRAELGGDVRADLRAYVRDEDGRVRAAAIRGIAADGTDPPDSTLEPELLARMTDPVADVRAAAAAALSLYSGDPHASCRTVLVTGLDDSNEDVRLASASSLHRKGAPATEAVPHLARWLRRGSAEERSLAVVLLGDMPEQAAPYESELRSLLTGAEKESRLRTLRALMATATQEGTLEVALELARHEDADIRVAANAILMRRFPDRAVVIDALKAALDDRSSFIVVPVATELIRRGIAIPRVVKACARLVADPDTHFAHRSDAIRLLGRCGRESGVAVSVLIAALDRPIWPGMDETVDPPWPGGNPLVDVFAALPEFAKEFVPPLVERAVRGNAVAVAALVKMEARAGEQIGAAMATLPDEQRDALEAAMRARWRAVAEQDDGARPR